MQPEMIPLTLIDRAALEHLKSKALQGSFSHYDVWLDQHKYAFTVAKMMDADMLAEVRSAIADALANGTGFADFQKRLKPYLMARGWWGEQVMIDPLDGQAKTVQLGSTRRLRRIFETNIATAHAASRWQRIERNAKAMPYLRYNPSASNHKRDDHKRYYGLILPVQHPIWQQIFPPNGYGCKCTVSQLTRGQAEREGISEEPNFEFVQVTNPRTGEVVKVPKDITPSFAHNHAKRVDAVLDLATERHEHEFVADLLKKTQVYLDNRVKQHQTANMFTGAVSFAPMTEDTFVLGNKTFLSKEEVAQLSGAVDGSVLTITEWETAQYPAMLITKAVAEEVYAAPSRHVVRLNDEGDLSLVIDMQKLVLEQQGKGISAFALRQQVRTAKMLGFKEFEAFAIGDINDPNHNGYYTWARLGFNAAIPTKLRNKLPENLKNAQELADLMETEQGRQWWYEYGSDIAVRFDLSDNSKSLKILRTYLWDKYGVNL